MFLFLVLSIPLALLLLELFLRFGRSGRLMRKIPGPKAVPIFGNVLSNFLTPEKLFIFQRSLVKKYGGVSQIHGLNFRMINVSNPEDIETLLSASSPNIKIHPLCYISNWIGEGLLVSNGKKWVHRRKMLTKAFNYNILQNFVVTFNEEADHFLKCVQNEVDGERFDIFPLMSHTTLRIMCATAMGSTSENMNLLTSKYLSSVNVVGDCFTKRLGAAWLHPTPIYQLTSAAKKESVAVKYLHSLTDNVIQNRKDLLAERNFNHFDQDESYQSKEKLAMLDLLLKNEKAGVIDHKGVREEVDTFMFAGHDTTAIAMTFFIMALANEPEIQEKVYQEICQVLGDSDRPLTTEDLNQLKYMDCCLKESVRLYPSAPLINRHVYKEMVLGGYTVPANTTAFIFIYDMHRRADLFPEPERFIPERFLPENSTKRHPYAYLAFGAGSRVCIGQKFAMLEMKTLMTKLLRKYRLEPVTRPQDIVYKTDIVMRTVNPIYVKLSERK